MNEYFCRSSRQTGGPNERTNSTTMSRTVASVARFKWVQKPLREATEPKSKEIIVEFSKDLGVDKQVLNHYMVSSYQGLDQ